MATKPNMQARQQELKFLSHQKRSGHGGGGGGGGGEDGETYTDQDDGSIARSSLDLSQEFRVAQGCFSSSLKRNFKAFCGRLGKWTSSHKKSSSLYRYLHLNVPLDPHLSPLVFQKQKSKSKQSLLDHPIEHSHINLPFDANLIPLVFHKKKSKSKHSLLDHPFDLKGHSQISDHEEIKDIHLDPQGTTFTTSIDGIKSTCLDLHEETKPQEHHPLISSINHGGDYQDQLKKLRAKPSLMEEQSQLVLASRDEESKCQSEILTGIHELMLGVTHNFGLEVNPLISINDEKFTSSRSLQGKIPKPNVHLAKPKPSLSLQGSNSLLSVNGQEKIIRSTFESNYTHPKVHDVDDILSCLATHVFSLRNQVIKGGFGGVRYPSLQGKEAIRQHGMNFNNWHENGDAYDVKKSMAGLISSRKFEDLADLEEFLQCYMRLYSPCFLDMVNQFFREICNDIFECESWFESKDPFIHT